MNTAIGCNSAFRWHDPPKASGRPVAAEARGPWRLAAGCPGHLLLVLKAASRKAKPCGSRRAVRSARE
jgi:hypothetical protein